MSIVGVLRLGSQARRGRRIGRACCMLLALINIFLGLLNLLPLLPFDGGHAVDRHLRGASASACSGRPYRADVAKLHARHLRRPDAVRLHLRAARSTSTSCTRSSEVGRCAIELRRPSEFARRRTRQIMVRGPVAVGGDAPITRAVDDDHQDRRRRRHAGPDLRAGRRRAPTSCAAPATSARRPRAWPSIVPRSPVPIIADIHNQYRMALAALEAGVHCLRLNPGNITQPRAHQDRGPRVQGPRRADPHRCQRRLARPGAVREVRRHGHARGDGRVGPVRARLLRRGRLRRREDLGQGVERARS